MKRNELLDRLNTWDDKGRYVWTQHDLKMQFPDDSSKSLEMSLRRFVRDGTLDRACRSVYVLPRARSDIGYTVEHIAIALRRGHYSYVSLESALSEYGAISQVPLSVVTVMTTGRSGLVNTTCGAIEFTHTRQSRSTILDGIVEIGRPLRFARARTALSDLRHVGRNLHLVDYEELEDVA
ncbi:hypothetical protein IMCC3135_10375 [Granulosicoccus antarcticus IMCC3135]|uniref:AbiEi antitoxin C-terminal domain-containing protein n=2 Tax=Granulosicoccus TaxID=437504 RepID=A0A2Z2NLX2_9GAMM|nr:hypothetical protein IMCC3135_10375 [Granulosicoccus antarcticus IMCC3135]